MVSDGIKGNVATYISGKYYKTLQLGTTRCRYNAVNFLQKLPNQHPTVRPKGRGMGCICEFKVWFIFCCCAWLQCCIVPFCNRTWLQYAWWCGKIDALQWRHNGHDSISNHQPYDCLLNRLFRRRSKKTSKLRVIRLCVGNSPGTSEFPKQKANNEENASIWWRHHVPFHIFHMHLFVFYTYPILIYKVCKKESVLTHWGRVTHKCISKLIIIGLDNGLAPGWRQAIIWTNAGIMLMGTLGIHLNEILSKVHTYSFKRMYLKMSTKWRPLCLGLNVQSISGKLFAKAYARCMFHSTGMYDAIICIGSLHELHASQTFKCDCLFLNMFQLTAKSTKPPQYWALYYYTDLIFWQSF